jgi:hypothetical protein
MENIKDIELKLIQRKVSKELRNSLTFIGIALILVLASIGLENYFHTKPIFSIISFFLLFFSIFLAGIIYKVGQKNFIIIGEMSLTKNQIIITINKKTTAYKYEEISGLRFLIHSYYAEDLFSRGRHYIGNGINSIIFYKDFTKIKQEFYLKNKMEKENVIAFAKLLRANIKKQND